MASLPLSRGSTYTSSDSDDSDADSAMLASCSLQEIREEDLAAILPDQQEIDAFNDFECNRTDKDSPAAGDLSGSDMELPQQAVNALIQRTTESSSENEGHPPPNPNSLYANSLLQEFVAQTQKLNATCTSIPTMSESLKPSLTTSTSELQNNKADHVENSKRRRGRPKKVEKETKNNDKPPEYCINPNVSPDSGIQNSPDHVSSPEPSLSPNIKPKSVLIKEDSKKVERSLENSSKKDKNIEKPQVVKSNIVNRRPGRPPKNKQPAAIASLSVTESKPSTVAVKSMDNQSKTLKSRQRTRPVLTTKNKFNMKSKFQTLKIPKLMHSKHKHKKHKKYKFKILKPIIAGDPKINIEIDKLIADFVKYCAIATKQPKENVPEQLLKTLKKVTKKRKTTDNEKKKKKQSVNTTVNKVHNSNEQRLPLKKRHYHLVSNSDNKNETEEIKNEINNESKTDPKIDKDKMKLKQTTTVSKLEKPKLTTNALKSEGQKSPTTIKHVPVIKSTTLPSKVSNINNNDYEVKENMKNIKVVGSHIDEAIEACINKFTEEKLLNKEKETPVAPDEKYNTSNGSITATTPKKRHRLEVSGGNSTEKLCPVVKVEECSSNSVEDDNMKPKISIESFISELKAKRNLIPKVPVVEDRKPIVEKEDRKEDVKIVIETSDQSVKTSPESGKKKVRKRRAINRTGWYVY